MFPKNALAAVCEKVNIFGSKLRKLQGVVQGSRAKRQYSAEGISWILRIGTCHSAGGARAPLSRYVGGGGVLFI